MTVVLKQPLTESSLTAKHPVGYEAMIGGKGYIYVLLDAGAGSLAASNVLTVKDRDTYEATADYSAGTGEFAGVLAAGGTFTDAEYAFIQHKGPVTVNKDASDDSYADGTGVIVDASSDGMAAKASADPGAVADINGWIGFARAASDDTNDTVEVGAAGHKF